MARQTEQRDQAEGKAFRPFVPSEDLRDAWERYQRGDEVTAWELRKLDEEREDHAWDQVYG